MREPGGAGMDAGSGTGIALLVCCRSGCALQPDEERWLEKRKPPYWFVVGQVAFSNLTKTGGLKNTNSTTTRWSGDQRDQGLILLDGRG